MHIAPAQCFFSCLASNDINSNFSSFNCISASEPNGCVHSWAERWLLASHLIKNSIQSQTSEQTFMEQSMPEISTFKQISHIIFNAFFVSIHTLSLDSSRLINFYDLQIFPKKKIPILTIWKFIVRDIWMVYSKFLGRSN